MTAVIFISTREGDEDRPWARHVIDASSIGADGARMADVTGDGHPDIAAAWEEGGLIRIYLNPGPGNAVWPSVTVGKVGDPEDAVFADLDGDGRRDILAPTREGRLMLYRKLAGDWRLTDLPFPPLRGGKAVSIGDIDLDGTADIVLTTEQAARSPHVIWMSRKPSGDLKQWRESDISGPEGSKFDLCPLVDLDGDGDLDVITTEEVGQLGLIWYENPLRRPV